MKRYAFLKYMYFPRRRWSKCKYTRQTLVHTRRAFPRTINKQPILQSRTGQPPVRQKLSMLMFRRIFYLFMLTSCAASAPWRLCLQVHGFFKISYLVHIVCAADVPPRSLSILICMGEWCTLLSLVETLFISCREYGRYKKALRERDSSRRRRSERSSYFYFTHFCVLRIVFFHIADLRLMRLSLERYVDGTGTQCL